MTIDIAIVPVAGQGTRLLPATKSQPKEMLPVGRKPVVQYVVEELALSGIRRLLFITSHGKTSIEQHFDIDAEADRPISARRARNSCSTWNSSGGRWSTSTRGSGGSWGWGMPCCARSRWSGINRSWLRWAIRLSGCTRNRTSWLG